MLKVEDDKINIYSKVNKEDIKLSLIYCGIGIIIAIILLIIFRHLFVFGLLLFSIILFIINLKIYKQPDIEKLVCTFSKDEFVLYRKKDKCEKYKISDIYSFAIFPSEYNEVIINYKNEKGKKDARIFMLKGYKNTKFVDMANEFLKSGLNIKEMAECITPKINGELEKNLKEGKKVINELIVESKKVKVSCLGKSKQFIKNGNAYKFERLDPEIAFVTEENAIIFVFFSEFKMDISNISLGNKYILSYDKEKKGFIIEEEKESIDFEKIEKIRNSIDFKLNLVSDEKKFRKEIVTINKVESIINLARILVCIDAIVFSLGMILKKYIAVKCSIFALFIIAIVFEITQKIIENCSGKIN